jgi:Zn-dependent protease/CBS domain-containing protein
VAPTIKLGKIFGIEISLNWSLIFIFIFIAYQLAVGALPQADPGQTAATYWVVGIIGAVAFYACLLAHELAHALVARSTGVKVAGITLWLFGGVSQLSTEPKSARDEALITVVGPLTSLAVALVAYGLAIVTDPMPLIANLFLWLAYVNAALALFNLIPAFPLDGGRLLSALLWWRQGTRQRGVRSAVRVGRVVAYLMIGLGVIGAVTTSVVNGLWIAFLGWFLLSAGSSEEAGVTMKAALRMVPVSAAMTSPVITIPDWLTVGQLLESVAPAHHFTTYPLHDPAGKLTGVVRLADLVKVAGGAQADSRLNAIARPISEVPTARPEEDLAGLIERIGMDLEKRVLVFSDGNLVGILSPVDVARILTVRQGAGRV